MMKPHQLAAIMGVLALGLVSASPSAQAAWVARGGSDAKFGWLEASQDEHFTGPLLQCVEPGKVAFSVSARGKGLQDGQEVTTVISDGTTELRFKGLVEEAPEDFSVSAPKTVGPSSILFGLFQGTGTFSVQVGNGPKATYSLKTAPAAFAKFAKACGLTTGTASPTAGK